MKTIKLISLIASAVLSVDLAAQEIADPVASFVAKYDRKPGERLLRLICDIDHDGKPDVFLANASSRERNGDCGWVHYLKRDGKYIEARGISDDGSVQPWIGATFNSFAYGIGNIVELGRWGLLTRETSTGKNGGTQLRAMVVNGNTFKMIDVGRFVLSQAMPTSGSTPAPGKVPNPPTPVIEEINP